MESVTIDWILQAPSDTIYCSESEFIWNRIQVDWNGVEFAGVPARVGGRFIRLDIKSLSFISRFGLGYGFLDIVNNILTHPSRWWTAILSILSMFQSNQTGNPWPALNQTE